MSRGCLQQLVALPALVEFEARPFSEDDGILASFSGNSAAMVHWDELSWTLRGELKDLQLAFERVGPSLTWGLLS